MNQVAFAIVVDYQLKNKGRKYSKNIRASNVMRRNKVSITRKNIN